MSLQVVTQNMTSPYVAFAQPMQFQFDLNGGAIISYFVVLDYFQLKYATDSEYNSEQVAQLGVRLISNLIGDTVVVTPQLLMTDGNGSAASEDQDVSGRDSFVTASVVAWVADSPPSNLSLQLLNAYGVQSQTSDVISIASGASYHSFLAGFGATFGNEMDEVCSLSASTDTSVENSTELTLETKTDLVGHSTAGYSMTDAGLVAFTNAMTGIALVDATVSVGSVNGTSGIDGTLSADITIPSGYSQIAAAIPLIDSFSISFGNNDAHHIAELAAGINGGPGGFGGTSFPITTSGTVDWDVHFNLWGERNLEHWYMDSASCSAKVLVQYA